MSDVTRDPRRRFNRDERTAAYVASGGRCTLCGVPLPEGWHADHVVAHSKGGATDAVNLQALCPSCNLRKGTAGPFELREWQRDALQHWRNTTGPFLAVATPGAGKTTFALSCLSDHRGFIVIVVPSTRLRFQWRQAALQFGLDILADYSNGDAIAEDVDGLVVTYATVASQPGLFRMFTSKRPTVVVLDEVHHCGDDQSWGAAVRQAFEPAHRHLMLSGTPFRKSSSPIPFVTYEGDPPRSRSDFTFGYEEAMSEKVVRSIEFACFDGLARWVEGRDIEERDLAQANTTEEGRALASALDPTSEWMGEVLPAASQQLDVLRESIPDAGGLVIAKDQWHARKVAERMGRIIGRSVPCAVSDDPSARHTIERFASGREPWLVAVRMVSEGVDIPRLMVLVYATNIREELFFKQAIGRVVRTRGDESDAYNATVFIPSVSSLTSMAREIERIRDHVLSEPIEKVGTEQRQFDLVETLPAIDGHFSSTIFGGDDYSDEELQRALSLMAQAQVSGASPVQVARLLRLAGFGKLTGKVQMEMPAPMVDREKLKADVNTLVKKLAARLRSDSDYTERGRAHSHAWVKVHDAVGRRTLKEYTVDDLMRARDLLVGWLND